MSVADIFKIQQAYNVHNKFNDQTDWKDAFNIANAFADTAEKHRANRENLATSDWRVNYQNNAYEQGIAQNKLKTADLQRLYNKNQQLDPSDIQAGIAQNNYMATNAVLGRQAVLGQDEAMKLIKEYGFNPDGSPRTLPQIWQAITPEQRATFSHYVFSPFFQAFNKEQQNQQAAKQAIVQAVEKQGFDANGNPIRTGQFDPQRLDFELTKQVISGQMTQEQADAMRKAMIPPPMNEQPQMQWSSLLSRFSGTPEQSSPPPLVVPYALETTQTAPQSTAPANTAVPQIDYRSRFNLNDADLALMNRLRAATGQSEQEALKSLNGYYLMRESGIQSPEKVNELILNEIIKAERHKNISAQLKAMPAIDPANEINRLIGNYRLPPSPLFHGINR